jgi:hypothetical protein
MTIFKSRACRCSPVQAPAANRYKRSGFVELVRAPRTLLWEEIGVDEHS